MIGHLTMFHTVTVVSPSPSVSPSSSANGPVTTRPSSTTAASSTVTTVIARFSGRSFQNGRPSSTS